jgi:hypothetical protein
MNTNEMIRYINYEILKNNDDLFEYLKKRVIKNELRTKKITNANVDEVVNRWISNLQKEKSINYSVLLIEQLKQFYNLQSTQVTLWNEDGGEQMFRNDSQKFNESSSEYQMHSELFKIEDRFGQSNRFSENDEEDPTMLCSLDKEIIPQPSYRSKYDNFGERLKLNIMDLEEDTSEEEEDRPKKQERKKVKINFSQERRD